MSTQPTPTPETDEVIERIADANMDFDVEYAELTKFARRLERLLRVGFGIRDDERIVLDQEPQHGSVLVDCGSQRRRVSPDDAQILALREELEKIKKDVGFSHDDKIKGIANTAPAVVQRLYPCGCVSCICQDEEQCHGCGAKSCDGTNCDWRRKIELVPLAKLQEAEADAERLAGALKHMVNCFQHPDQLADEALATHEARKQAKV